MLRRCETSVPQPYHRWFRAYKHNLNLQNDGGLQMSTPPAKHRWAGPQPAASTDVCPATGRCQMTLKTNGKARNVQCNNGGA